MGAHPYYYVVPYLPEVDLLFPEMKDDREACARVALERLRRREFSAGRYNPVIPFLDFPIDPDAPSPGARHASIEEALEASGQDGTRSILDLDRISTSPDFCAACLLDDDSLLSLYGTAKPSAAMVLSDWEVFEEIERGQGVYIILYEGDEPAGIYFAGYSFD